MIETQLVPVGRSTLNPIALPSCLMQTKEAGFISNFVTKRNKVLIFQMKMEIFFLLTASAALFLSELSSGKQPRLQFYCHIKHCIVF